MDRFVNPSPAEMAIYLRRAHALRSDAICGFFRWLMRALRPHHDVPAPRSYA